MSEFQTGRGDQSSEDSNVEAAGSVELGRHDQDMYNGEQNLSPEAAFSECIRIMDELNFSEEQRQEVAKATMQAIGEVHWKPYVDSLEKK